MSVFRAICLINAVSLSAAIFRRSPFLQFKKFELYWGAVLKMSSQIFTIFEVMIFMILVTPKQEVVQKSGWFCGVNFCARFLMWSEKAVFEQKFAFLLVVFLFTCGNF